MENFDPNALDENQQFQNYIKQVCSKVPKGKRAKVKYELTSHIMELVIDHVEVGQPIERAIENALKQFGEANQLRRQIYQVHKPFYHRRKFVYPFLVFCIFQFFCIGVVEMYNHDADKKIKQKITYFAKNEAKLAYFDKINQQSNFYLNKATGRDLGEVINSRIPWTNQGQFHDREIDSSISDNSLKLPDDLVEKIENNQKREMWVEQLTNIDLSKLDLRWMNSLSEFDIWDMNQIEENQKSKLSILDAPTPYYRNLKHYGKIVIANGIKTNTLEKAIRNAEHFSRLMYTNENMMGAMLALSIQSDIQIGYEYGLKNKLIDPDFKLKVQRDQVTALRKSLLYRGYYFDFVFESDKIEQLYSVSKEQQQSHVGYCHGISNGIFMMTLISKYFDGRYPFEKKLQNNVHKMNKIINSSKNVCRLQYERKMWGDHKNVATLFDMIKIYDGGHRAPGIRIEDKVLYVSSKIPYLRQIAAKVMIAGRPDFSGLVHEYIVLGNR